MVQKVHAGAKNKNFSINLESSFSVLKNQQQTLTGRVIAAIDLGSNSFHMVVAHNYNGQIKIVDRLKEMVRLGSGLNQTQQLDPEVMDNALACLRRFGQRLRDMHADSVRVIATNALRSAKDPKHFLKQAQQALGYSVEIISGIEEARLIYQGTVYSISRPEEKRIVVDIGGGSTEIIVGQGHRPMHMESLFMGCVSYSEHYFKHQKITGKGFERAGVAATQQLRPIVKKFKRIGWDIELGTSGTIKSIIEIVQQKSIMHDGLSLQDLYKLREVLISYGHIDAVDFAGIKPERIAVLTGGLAILISIFENLNLDRLSFSEGALREGVLYDLLGRLEVDHHDVRVTTVAALEARYAIEKEQADRVEKDALKLFDLVQDSWLLDAGAHKKHLCWASRLHEIGLDIAHTSYHQHGAYLMKHMDMPGFSRDEQIILASLIGCHRRKIRPIFFEGLDHGSKQIVEYLLILLRLAVLLNRDRSDNPWPIKKIKINDQTIQITFRQDWLQQFPLTKLDLEQENIYLRAINYQLNFS